MLGGGAERQLAYLASEMPRRGWDVHVALVHDGPNLERLERAGATIHRLGGRGRYDPRLLIDLIRVVRRVKPDVVQAWLLQMEVMGGLAALATGTPWILAERTSAFHHPANLKNQLRLFMGWLANAVVSNSAGGDQYWHEQGAARVRRYVVCNALPLDEIAATAPVRGEESGVRPDEQLVLFVGRLSAEKNIARVVESVSRLLQRVPARAVFCGDGPERPRVEQLLQSHGVQDRARIAGFVSNPWAWMKRADAVVSLSLGEGNPNVVLEAMACETPLVVSDIPAHREILDDEAAWFVDPTSADATADALEALLGNREGAVRRARLARARVEQHALSDIARQYDDVYRDVVANSTPVPGRIAL